jgi:histidine triad (HIT) family protein
VSTAADDDASDCLFCKVLDGRVPSTTVAETDGAYAFRDINPAMPTHVLVIPRRHITNAGTLTPSDGDDLSAVFQLATQVAQQEGLDDPDKGYRLVFNVGRQSGNTVPHLHLHVLGGRSMGWPPG